ncbi:hypothetical protein HK101_005999 [Irineochytrium annulatum]|nr:hypothetical protein HK101_005999 [Irineochytrium annulatum]
MSRCFAEQRIQAQALSVAVTNLDGHSKSVCDGFDSYNQRAQKDFAKHAGLLKKYLRTFPSDLQALHRIPIHPNIVEDHRFLSDFVPEEKLVTWAENCRSAHEQLVRKTANVAETVNAIKQGTESEKNQVIDLDFSKLETVVDTVKDLVVKIDQRRQTLERDYGRVESSLHTLMQSPPSQTPDIIQALDHLYEIHRSEYLPALTQLDTQVRTTLNLLAESRVSLSHHLILRLQSISTLQSSIAEIGPLLSTLSGTLSSQSQAFSHLLHVHRMPPAWGATLVEVARRKEYVKVFLSKAKEMAEVLAKFRSQEEKRRENFKGEIERYLPQGVVKGLEDKPPSCEISVSGTKDGLPDISRNDVVDFEKLVANLRTAMNEVDPGSSTATGTTIGGEGQSDSISKLHATMVKMGGQVDGIEKEFERILGRSGLCKGLDEEVARLRQELAALRGATKGLSGEGSPRMRNGIGGKAVSVGAFDGRDTEGYSSRAEETIKAYENRIKTLEKVLQQSYQMTSSQTKSEEGALRAALAALQADNKELRERVAKAEAKSSEAWTSASNAEERVKVAENGRKVAEEERDSYRVQFGVAEKDVGDLKKEIAGLIRDRGALVGEFDRVAGFVREVYALLDACSQALTVHEAGAPELTGAIPVPERASPIIVRSASTPSNNAASPLVPPLSPLMGHRHSISIQPTGFTESSPPIVSPRTPGISGLGVPALISLRSDEREIRRRLRELEDDIRCQTLELVGLQRENAALRVQQAQVLEDSVEEDYDEEDESSGVGSGRRAMVSLDEMTGGITERDDGEAERLAIMIADLNNEIDGLRATLAAENNRYNVLGELLSTEQALRRESEDAKRLVSADLENAKEELQRVAKESQDSVAVQSKALDEERRRAELLEDELRALKSAVEKADGDLQEERLKLEHGEAKIETYQAKVRSFVEQLEDWQVVWRLAMEQVAARHEAITRIGTAIARFEGATGKVLASIGGNAPSKAVLDLARSVVADGVMDNDEAAGITAGLEPPPLELKASNLFDSQSFAHSEMDGSSPSSRIFSSGNGFPAGVGTASAIGSSSEAEVANFAEVLKEAYSKVAGVKEAFDIGTWTGTVVEVVDGFRSRFEALRDVLLNELKEKSGKITFQRFQTHDLVLFLPTRNPKAWAAFNVNAPHYFLSTESSLRFPTQMKNRDWILANITSIDARVASGRQDPSRNPFGLAEGTRFFWCEVEDAGYAGAKAETRQPPPRKPPVAPDDSGSGSISLNASQIVVSGTKVGVATDDGKDRSSIKHSPA